MISLTCYGCGDLERDCCGAAVVEECFSGLMLSGDDNTRLYHPYDFFVNSTGAYVADLQGNYTTFALSQTDFGTIGELTEYLEKCKCGGIFRQEYYGVNGQTFEFTENNGHIPADQDKAHLLIDGREKRQGEWSVSGSDINTTFKIFPDNRVIFWYQLF